MKYYIDCDNVTMCYPYEVSKYLKDLGVLERYRDKYYTLSEINKIIAELMVKVPYVSNSMEISLNVMSLNSNDKDYPGHNVRGYHHILTFNNYNYEEQKRTNNEIKFLFEN